MLSWLRGCVRSLMNFKSRPCREIDFSVFDCEVRRLAEREVCVTCGQHWPVGSSNPCNLVKLGHAT